MQMNPSASFGELLRHHRRTTGLTQEELAERAALSWRGINDLERGVRRHPRRDTVARLVEALSLTDDERATFEAASRHAHDQATRSVATVTTVKPDPAPPGLPTGTVTFLFTDVEGSTHLLLQLGDRFAETLEAHRTLLRAAWDAHYGSEVDTQGDSFFVAFPTARDALAAAAEGQRALAAYSWPAGTALTVRMGLHTGMPQLVGDHYVGLDVHRAARIAAAGHGGQTLLSEATHALTESVLPKGTSLRDLGEHRLKDLQQTERLFQLIIHGMPDDFPPLKTLDRHAYNLPMLPTPLIGREQAVRQVVDLLRREDVRLVTLTGTGGTGKTRLGLQVAAEVADAFTDGVWFVRLSRLTDPALVVPTIAQTLNLRESGDLPVNEILAEWLRQRNLLLLLDNFEQVVEAAVEVADLLATSLGLKVVVTSRVALHLQGEHEFPVAPLSLAGAHSTTVEDSPAVMLFVQRAMAIRPDFQVSEATAPAVFAICERLDGLPLAIELAATRVKALPLTVLLQRLERQLPLLTGGARDLEARQQTMRHTLAWSYDLLRPEEQRLFQRLAVFVGGWALEAAEAVCMSPGGVEPLDLDLLDGLSTLVDHSLVQSHEEWGDARFTMLQVIREYALEQLEANGEAGAIRRAHLTYYLGLAEEGETAAYRSGAEAWLGQFEREHDNFLAALAWAYQQGEAELGLRLAGALTHTWETRDNYSEGRGWLERLLTLPMADVSVPTRAKALCGVGVFAHFLADDDQSLAASEASLALTQSEQPGWVTAMAINLLGTVAWHRGDLERATTYFQEGVARLRAAGELGLAAEFTVDMGRLAAKQEDLERATAYYEEALALAQRAGIAIPAGEALGEMAEVARRQGDLLRAVTLGHEQFKTWRRVRSPGYLSMGLEGLALTAAVIGDGRRTARLLGARAALHELGDSAQHIRSFWRWADTEGAVAAVRATMGEEAWQATFEAGKALALEEAIAEALEEDGEERSPQD